MKTKREEDGSTSYTLTETEKMILAAGLAFLYGRRTGYNKGRTLMAREIKRTGSPQP